MSVIKMDLRKGVSRLYTKEGMKVSGSRKRVGVLQDNDVSAVIVFQWKQQTSRSTVRTFFVFVDDQGEEMERLPTFVANEPPK